MPTISFKIKGRDSGDIARQMDDYKLAIRFGDFHARRLVEYLDLQEHGEGYRLSCQLTVKGDMALAMKLKDILG